MAHKKPRVNWHEAATCAFQIELQDYSDLLEYITKYILGKNNYRIDLLIIKKLTDAVIPKNIALIFKTFNLLEVKGIGSSVGTDSYYKMIGYTCLLIDQAGKRNQYSALDVSLTFLSYHYPRNLMRHLRKERNLAVAKVSPGVYHINKERFVAQIIVTRELPPKDNLYLRCLTDNLSDAEYYLPKIDQLSSQNNNLSSQINYLKSLLTQHGIPFDLDTKPDNC